MTTNLLGSYQRPVLNQDPSTVAIAGGATLTLVSTVAGPSSGTISAALVSDVPLVVTLTCGTNVSSVTGTNVILSVNSIPGAQVTLTANASTAPSFKVSGNVVEIDAPVISLASIYALFTAAGQLIVSTGPGAGELLAAGSNGQVLTMVSGEPAWAPASGGGGGGPTGVPLLVEMDTAGFARTSTDGVTWVPQTSGVSGNATGCAAWSPTLALFVLGGNGHISTSPDGVHWTVRDTTVPKWVNAVWAAGLGLFVLVGSNGTAGAAITSPDGITWTPQAGITVPFPAGKVAIGLGWSPSLGLLVALSGANIATSPDGVTWTARALTPVTAFGSQVAWSAALALFVIVGNDGTNAVAWTSPDGITWTSHLILAGLSGVGGVAWSPYLGLFVAAVSINGGGVSVYTSPDGATWTLRTIPTPPTGTADRAFWAPYHALFFVTGRNAAAPAYVASSPDGITWTQRTVATTTIALDAIVDGAPVPAVV